jgi:hypothetical protein
MIEDFFEKHGLVAWAKARSGMPNLWFDVLHRVGFASLSPP